MTRRFRRSKRTPFDETKRKIDFSFQQTWGGRGSIETIGTVDGHSHHLWLRFHGQSITSKGVKRSNLKNATLQAA